MKKKKHIALKIVLSVFLLLLLAGGVLVGTHWELAKGAYHLLKNSPGNNVKAAWIFLTGNSETIQKQISDNDASYSEAVKKIAEELSGTGLDLSRYTLDVLSSGEYSEEEMIRILMGKETIAPPDTENTPSDDPDKADKTDKTENTADGKGETPQTPPAGEKNEGGNGEGNGSGKPAQTPDAPTVADTKSQTDSETKTAPAPGGTPAGEGTASEDAMSEEVAACIAKLYVLKSRFTGQLGALEKTIIDAYEAQPEEEQTPASRKSIAGQYIKQVSRMELDCDAQVDAALAELRKTLTAQGKDTAVVETLRQAYENEKSLKKAYYLDVYMNGI